MFCISPLGSLEIKIQLAKNGISPSDEQDELRFIFRKIITTRNVIYVSDVEFCAESNGANRAAETWSKKKRTQKNYKKRKKKWAKNILIQTN